MLLVSEGAMEQTPVEALPITNVTGEIHGAGSPLIWPDDNPEVLVVVHASRVNRDRESGVFFRDGR